MGIKSSSTHPARSERKIEIEKSWKSIKEKNQKFKDKTVIVDN